MSTVKPVQLAFRMLRDHRRLVVFPLLSAAALVVISGAVAVPVFLRERAGSSSQAVEAVVVGLGYLLLGFLFTLSGAAMICAVDDVLRGEPARIGASYARAARRWWPLLGWSLLSTTVLLLIRQLERVPVVGWILDALFSAAWAAATYLALPAMMIDGLGVAEGTRRSARMLRETFTRQVYGSLWIALPLIFAVFLGFAAFMVGLASNRLGPAVAGGVVAALVLAGALLVGATVSTIFRTVLYRDAAQAA
ncbi:hypothetical protein CFP65_0292 [Kitasatospora sp. MMS16-BH015]|uniref:DUF6159 family protein n=1 Tax=Kitasatospora sp. MMS16-BH015 TaxID=2018025 RepID=UPI000CA1B6F4|nr:DUF6159 family protein [Kitasatospora sp. MMS16-BH015]AUG75267.1 hypothetical protein CFP65_0292 [Kitasatospora sp. MMS16-BH015]